MGSLCMSVCSYKLMHFKLTLCGIISRTTYSILVYLKINCSETVKLLRIYISHMYLMFVTTCALDYSSTHISNKFHNQCKQ